MLTSSIVVVGIVGFYLDRRHAQAKEFIEVKSPSGTWRRCSIIGRRGDGEDGELHVHYEGYTDKYDEWISAKEKARIRKDGTGKCAKPGQHANEAAALLAAEQSKKKDEQAAITAGASKKDD